MNIHPEIIIHGPAGSCKSKVADAVSSGLQEYGYSVVVSEEGEPFDLTDVYGSGPLIKITQTNVAPDAEFAVTLPDAEASPFQSTRRLYSEKMVVLGAEAINKMVADIHGRNVAAGWWSDLQTGESLLGKRNFGELLCLLGKRNFGELLCLVHSEISEAMEGHRKNLMDDHLPDRPMAEVELADAIIRIFDIAGGYGFDLGGAVAAKLDYNARRADHKVENRKLADGKKY